MRKRDLIQPTGLTKAIFWYAVFTLVHSFVMYFLGKGGFYELMLASRLIVYPAIVYFATVQVNRDERAIGKSIKAAEWIAVSVMVGYLLLNLFPELTFLGFIKAGDFSGTGLTREGISRFFIPGEMFLTFYVAYFLCKVSSRFHPKDIILLLLSVVAVTLTYTRAIWVAIGVSFLAFWLIETKMSKKIFSGAVIFLAMLVLLAAAPDRLYFYSQRAASIVPDILAGSNDPTTTVAFRVIEVQQALEKFLEQPILGVGIGMPYRSAAASLFLTATAKEWKAYLVMVHNGFVDVLVHQGLIGFLFFMNILYQVFIRLRFSRAFPFKTWSGDLKIVWYCLLTFFAMAVGGGNGFTSGLEFTMFFFFFFALLDAGEMNYKRYIATNQKTSA